MEQHPDLSINLLLGDSIVDFYLDKMDLAIDMVIRAIQRWWHLNWQRWNEFNRLLQNI